MAAPVLTAVPSEKAQIGPDPDFIGRHAISVRACAAALAGQCQAQIFGRDPLQAKLRQGLGACVHVGNAPLQEVAAGKNRGFFRRVDEPQTDHSDAVLRPADTGCQSVACAPQSDGPPSWRSVSRSLST